MQRKKYMLYSCFVIVDVLVIFSLSSFCFIDVQVSNNEFSS
jgi:hypothetical protein